MNATGVGIAHSTPPAQSLAHQTFRRLLGIRMAREGYFNFLKMACPSGGRPTNPGTLGHKVLTSPRSPPQLIGRFVRRENIDATKRKEGKDRCHCTWTFIRMCKG